MTAGASKTPESRTPGHGDKSRLREKAIAALLTAPTVARAASAAGVSRETLFRWLQEADFKAAMLVARREVVSAAISRLQAVTTDAVNTLHRSLTCEVPTVEVSAARTILEYGFRAKEIEEIETRLAALEERVTREAEQ